MGPCRSCWDGTTSALQPEEIASKGLEFYVCTINKSANTKKSLETYRMHLVHIYIYIYKISSPPDGKQAQFIRHVQKFPMFFVFKTSHKIFFSFYSITYALLVYTYVFVLCSSLLFFFGICLAPTKPQCDTRPFYVGSDNEPRLKYAASIKIS